MLDPHFDYTLQKSQKEREREREREREIYCEVNVTTNSCKCHSAENDEQMFTANP